MDTARVEIIYRPLRIGWLLRSGDFDGFRKIARLSLTLAGGRYNPIILVDGENADQIANLFRVDMLMPISAGGDIDAFVARYSHLIQPHFGEPNLHFPRQNGAPGVHVLDITNLLTHGRRDDEWQSILKFGLRRFVWQDDDPLADALLMEHGQFPTRDDVHFDYAELLRNAAAPDTISDVQIQRDQALPIDVATHAGLSVLGRFATSPYTIDMSRGWNFPGFYIGQADNLNDLVDFWNLRAASIALRFIDDRHIDRYSLSLPAMREQLEGMVAHLDDHRRRIALWSREELEQEEIAAFVGKDRQPTVCKVDRVIWNGLNVKAPRIILGSSDALGVVVEKWGKLTVSFSLADKPFSGDFEFYQQQLVASISMFSGRQQEDATFALPYVPQLNELFAHATGQQYSHLRVEHDRLGIVIDAHDASVSVSAMQTMALIEAIFKQVGLKAKTSNAGAIARQLIAQMGGIDGVRAFKIPGVRRLIRTTGLNDSINKSTAYSIIGERDPKNPDANFADYHDLFIEPRPFETKLNPPLVFSHLVEKRIFRIGADLLCPTCNLKSWMSIDELAQRVDCAYCGAAFDTPKQLLDGELTYRRSGLLGIERNLQGAIPVALVLQQLSLNVFRGGMSSAVFSPSLDIEALDGSWEAPKELDFFAMEFGRYAQSDRIRVVFGEAKDRVKPFDAIDAATMRAVAAAFPSNRFDCYIIFAKLGAFSNDEIALAGDLAQMHNVILLTHNELEPLHTYDRATEELKRLSRSLDGLVQGTAMQYPTLKRRYPGE